jgi:thiol:disulfide interchange protein
MPVINGRGYNSQIWLIGANGLDRALALSNEFHAPIMIYYQADWCGYCRRLEKELLSNLGAKDILAGVIKVLLSPEFGGRDKQLFKQMGGNGYPSIYFMKNGNSPPKKEWLMKQINGQWQTIRVSELALLVKSIQH